MQQQNKAAITALTAETPSHVKGSTTLSPVTWLFSRIFLPKRILRLYVLLGRPQRSTESMPAEPGKQCAPIRELPSPGWQVKEECTQSQPHRGHTASREKQLPLNPKEKPGYGPPNKGTTFWENGISLQSTHWMRTVVLLGEPDGQLTGQGLCLQLLL